MLPKEYKLVRSVEDLSGLTGHCLAYHPGFVRHFLPKPMYTVNGTYLTYFDLEVEEWLPAPHHAVFGLPTDLSFIPHLVPITNFSLREKIDGFPKEADIAVEHWLEVDLMTHFAKTLRRKRVKPLQSYYEKCGEEVTVSPGRIDMSRWDEYVEWGRLRFGAGNWLIEMHGEMRSFFKDSDLAMPISFFIKDRLIGVYLGGAVPRQYEMFTHVCDQEFTRYSKFMIMAALDFGVRTYGRTYTMPDYYEDDDEFRKDWKNLWQLPRRPFYSYCHDHDRYPEAVRVRGPLGAR